MNNTEKIDLINDRINQINIHIDLLQNNINSGFTAKPGQPTFEENIQDFILKRQVLEEQKISLTN